MSLEKESRFSSLWAWVDSQNPTRNTRLDKALTYVKNRRETSMTYLEDGRCSFTNNLSENTIQPFTVGRKNWLFSDSVEGAQASAITYTMVEMAKAHNLNIYGYLSYVWSKGRMKPGVMSSLQNWHPGAKTPNSKI